MKTRVLIVDDHSLVRAGIRLLVDKMAGFEVAGEASNGLEALDQSRTTKPDMVLLDIAMGEPSGLEVLPEIAKEIPGAKILICSSHTNPEYIAAALRSGAAGYIVKDATPAELEMALQALAGGKTYLSPAVSRQVISGFLQKTEPAAAADPLTARQREILQLIAEGRNTKEIAGILDLSTKTVETHRLQLMGRLGIREVAGLVRYAIRTGIASAEK